MPEPRRTWRHFRIVAGVPDVTLHDLRRTLGSWMAITGASLPVIARALGHKLEQSSVTAVYARLNNQPVRDAIEKAVNKMMLSERFADLINASKG
jgi:integrase